MKKFYTQSTEEVLQELDVGSEGLTSAQAEERLAKYGPNKLKETEKPTLLQRFLAQLKDPMLIILLVAAGVSRKVVKSGKLHTASGILMVLLGVLLFLPVAVCLLGML